MKDFGLIRLKYFIQIMKVKGFLGFWRSKRFAIGYFGRGFFFFYFFFFYDIDERRRYSKKVHPLKALVGPSIVKRRIRGDLWAG